MPYTVCFAPAAARELRKLAPAERRQIARRIDSLADDPRPDGCAKLKGAAGLYRIRVGDFRIVYRIDENALIVLVAAIGNRRDIYDELKRL